MMMHRPRFVLGLILLTALAAAAPAAAQSSLFTGRIEVTVVDQSGAVLPGVTVTLSGPASQEASSGEFGEARFLTLPVGTYTVEAKLAGFSDYRNTAVVVVSGQTVQLRVRLAVAGREEMIQVTGEAPIVDAKKLTTSTNVRLDELQNIPSARDPWVVMQTVPGIVVDRVNVGGSESGQQSNYISKGADTVENTWSLDGVPITDMSAAGSSPTYFDFDMFEEMQVTTGGADASTPGVALNMILRSGTDTPHGSARYFYENEGMQSENLSDELKVSICPASNPDCKGNRTDNYYDTGFELGGPIRKGMLWAWGSYGKTDVKILTLRGTPDQTILENAAFKTSAAFGQVRPSFTYFYGNKEKFGRGASPTRPAETTWDQTGPTHFYKGEVSFVVANDLFLVGRYAYTSSMFELVPKGGLDADWWMDEGGVQHGTSYYYKTDRPQQAAIVEGNWFKGQHEIKFGYVWRKAPVESQSLMPGWGGAMEILDSTTRDAIAYYYRYKFQNFNGQYQSLWFGDTMTFNRWTVNAALRWDHSTSSLDESTVPANASLPEYLPSLTAPAVKDAISWNTLSPRVGVSYALTQDRKTVLRASYAMFAGSLLASEGTDVSPIQYSGIYYYAVDANGNNRPDPGEVDFDAGLIGYYGFDIENPSSLESINRIDEDVSAPRTHEFIVGLDHELVPNFGVSAAFTYRYFQNLTWFPIIGVRAPDYELDYNFTGSAAEVGDFSVPIYALPESKVPPGAGSEFINRDGYHQRFWGIELSATKRLANRWMARFGFSTNDHREYFDDPATSIQDPTPLMWTSAAAQGCFTGECGPNVDGGVVGVQSAGSGKTGIWLMLPKYQFTANGLYQGPWGLNFSANWVLRQGYNMPFSRSNVTSDDAAVGLKTVFIVEEVDDFRLPTLQTVDVRAEKAFAIQKVKLIFDLDVFNLFNWNTELQRQYDLRRTGTTGYNQVLEVLQPRILRLGVRMTF